MVAQRLQFKGSLVDAKDIYTKTVCKDLETKEGFAKTAGTIINKTSIQTSSTIL